MNFDDYDTSVRKRMNVELFRSDKAPDYGALKLASEAGEVAGIIGKLHHGKPYDENDLIAELGDCLWYVSYLAQRAGFSLEEVAKLNDIKLAKRHGEVYNKEFYAGNS